MFVIGAFAVLGVASGIGYLSGASRSHPTKHTLFLHRGCWTKVQLASNLLIHRPAPAPTRPPAPTMYRYTVLRSHPCVS